MKPVSRLGLELKGLSYSLSESSTVLRVDEHSGHLSLTGSLDYETKKLHEATLSVKDNSER